MRILFLSCFLLFSTGALHAQGLLYHSFFQRLNNTDFRAASFFSGGSGTCFSLQSRKEMLRNDTLFLMIAYETRLFVNAMGCGRADTVSRTSFDPEIRYINVSTGVITFNQQDFTLADTLWRVFDSTFAVPPPPAFVPYVQGDQLKVTGPEAVSALTLFDVNGKLLLKENDHAADIPFLAAGVYLLRIVAASGAEETIRWYRE